MATHRIRLRGLWGFEWVTAPPALPSDRRVGRLALPTTWREGLGPHAGTVRLSRRFGRPPEPDSSDRVWLEIRCRGVHVTAVLNGDQIGASTEGALRVEVTGRLAARNRLDLDLSSDEPSGPDAPLPEVALAFEDLDEDE